MIFEDTKMTWHATNSYKFHVICSEIKYIYIYHYFVRYKHDLTCNQFIQISCNLFWNIYIYISVFCKIQKWSEMQPNLCNFHVICSEQNIMYMYHHISKYKNDLKCNQFIQISCHWFWNYMYIYIYIMIV